MSSGDDEEDFGAAGTSSVGFSYGAADDVDLGQEEHSDGGESASNASERHLGHQVVLRASAYKDEEVSFDQSSCEEEDSNELEENTKSSLNKSLPDLDSSTTKRSDRRSDSANVGDSFLEADAKKDGNAESREERSSDCEISVRSSSDEEEAENGGHAVNDLGDEQNPSGEDDEVEFECNNWEIDEMGVVDEAHAMSEGPEPEPPVDPLVERAFPDLVSKYRIFARLGEGSYSSVYLGKPIEPLNGHEYVALKRLYPISAPNRIVNEISLLKELQGLNNVVPLLRVHRFQDNITLVLPYYESHHPREYIREMTVSHVRNYMRSLFTALQHVHAHKIIHRDVKPTNFLYSVETEQFTLLDFGLAQRQSELEAYNLEFLTAQEAAAAAAAAAAASQQASGHLPFESDSNQRKRKSSEAFNSDHLESASKRRKVGEDSGSHESSSLFTASAMQDARLPAAHNKDSSSKRMPGTAGSAQGGGRTAPLFSRRRPQAPRAGTRGFRPPEVLMRYPHQTVAVDIWSAGVTLLCILSQRYPFFQSPDDLTALCEIACVCGSEQLQFVATNVLQKSFHPPTFYRKCDWKELCEKLQKDAWDSKLCNVPDSAYDLLDRCLDPNPFTRITAEAALRHPFLVQTVAL